jgi:VIT1/CCC1 family predicted Fe2+/Mn2+ transporter
VKELVSWYEEQRSAYLYRLLAQIEAGAPRARLFAELAKEADEQSKIWSAAAVKRGARVPGGYRPDMRTRLVAAMTWRLGPRAMRSVLAAMKVRGMSVYSTAVPGHPMPHAGSGPERRHRGLATGGNLRAGVFGINDGLVSNASLILGVAGASADSKLLLLSGVAGLLAGAFSMAAGEYVSVRSQREMYEYQIGLEKEELAEYPQEEAAELALIYEARGLSSAQSKELADSMIADPDKGLDALAREELGLNPDELGSPWGAALFSFVSFGIGAVIPLLPFMLAPGSSALPISIAATALSLFAVGAMLSLFTGRQAWLGGLRMLLIGGSAGAVTYLIGKLLGVSLS